MEQHVLTSSLGGVEECDMSVTVMIIQIEEFTGNMVWSLLHNSQNLYMHEDNSALILNIL
jgi:hypothetical protein